MEPGFQQRAIRRLQLPENKAATERRLTEAIAAQQLRPGSAAADEKSEPPAPIFVEGDPRLLWTQPRSEAWHAAKQAEIRARPKRKARFGKAAESLRMQLRQDQQKHGDNAVPGKRDRAEDLPVVIRTNEQWMKVMEAMGWLAVSDSGDKEVNNSMVKRKTRGLGK